MAGDRGIHVCDPRSLNGNFDVILALAVLQREPHRIAHSEIRDLTEEYPFARFDAAIHDLFRRLRQDGLLVVVHAHYPVELSSVMNGLEGLDDAVVPDRPMFDRLSRRIDDFPIRAIFRKR